MLKRTALGEQKNSPYFTTCLPYIPKSSKVRIEIEQENEIKASLKANILAGSDAFEG